VALKLIQRIIIDRRKLAASHVAKIEVVEGDAAHVERGRARLKIFQPSGRKAYVTFPPMVVFFALARS